MLTVVLLLPLASQAEQPYELASLYTLAKSKDPVIGRAAARLETTKADYDITFAGVLPRIEGSASEKSFWHTIENYYPQTEDGHYNGYSYVIGGRYPLLSMPVWYNLSAAEAGIRSAASASDLARQDLLTRLVSAYTRFVKAKADERVYTEEKSRLSRILEQAEAFLKAGTGDIIAVHEARARLDSAGADLIKAQGEQRLAEQTLTNLTGVTVTAVRDLSVAAPAPPQPADLNWWIETMQQRNPAIRQAREDLTQAEEGVKAADAGHLPSINLYGGYTVEKGSTFIPDVITSQWYITATLTVPIYYGGETNARTRKAVAGEAERRFMLTDARDQRLQRLKEAFVKLQYSVALAEAYQRKLASAETQLKAVQKGLTLGTRTAIDLLNAEQKYSISQRDLTSALYDNFQYQIELKAAAGILEESDLTAIAYK
jgi:outer membrane protein